MNDAFHIAGLPLSLDAQERQDAWAAAQERARQLETATDTDAARLQAMWDATRDLGG